MLAIALIIMLTIGLVIMLQTLHIVAIHDDDWTSTAADIAAADFIDGESIVQTRDGQVPKLRGIHIGSGALTAVNSIAYQAQGSAHMTLMPSTWKETNKLWKYIDVRGMPEQDGTTATDFNNTISQNVYLDDWNGGFDIQLTENMNWVNTGDSQMVSTNAAVSNQVALLVYQYGPTIPWSGSTWPCVYVTKQAAVDITADVWCDVCNELFTDDGLDPDATYRPYIGVMKPEGILDSVALAWRMTTSDHKTWIGGLGPGSAFGNLVWTRFCNDSMLINGDSQIHIQALGDAASKPIVTIGFQEVSKGAEPGKSGASPMARGPIAGASLRMPSIARRLG